MVCRKDERRAYEEFSGIGHQKQGWKRGRVTFFDIAQQ